MEHDKLFDGWDPLELETLDDEKDDEDVEILGFLAGDWAVDAELLGFFGF